MLTLGTFLRVSVFDAPAHAASVAPKLLWGSGVPGFGFRELYGILEGGGPSKAPFSAFDSLKFYWLAL